MSRAKCTDGPWCIPDGEGNELIVCAGDDPNHHGEILFVLHPPAGVKITMDYEDMASMARLCAAAPDLLAALDAALPIIGDRSAGGRMLTPQERAAEVFRQCRDAISRATGEA